MKKRFRLKRILCACLAVSIVFAAGCNKKDDSKVSITVGNYPDESNSMYEQFESYRKEFERLNPDVEFIPDHGDSSFKVFMTKGVANQLPGIQSLPFTEMNKVSESGFVKDLSSELEKRGFLDALNPKLREMVTTEDGKIYCLPMNSYTLGLVINKDLFTKAGLINEDGSVKIPETYEELAEYANIIKEKTGKAGFVMQTMNNCGGWLFMPIAWSHGVNFVKEQSGKWKATFNSDEMIKALQYVYDLKWKYNTLPDNALIDTNECQKLFATGEAAMYIAAPIEKNLVTKYSMDVKNLVWASVPAGPDGRYSLLGGAFWVMNNNYNDKQIDALFSWLKVRGVTPEFNEDTIKAWETTYSEQNKAGEPVPPVALFNLWEGDEERIAKENEIRNKYANMTMDSIAHYADADDVILRAEEPVACQELYAILDSGLQEILTNKNVDIKKLVKKMNDDFQKNSLDGLEE